MAKVDGAETRVVIRSTTRWVVCGIYALIAAAGCLGLIFGTAGAVKSTFTIIAIAGFIVLAFRGVRSSIEVDPQDLTARADRFTRRLHWSDVDRFEIRTVGWSTGLGAWKKNGSWVRLTDRGYDSRQRYESALRAPDSACATTLAVDQRRATARAVGPEIVTTVGQPT